MPSDTFPYSRPLVCLQNDIWYSIKQVVRWAHIVFKNHDGGMIVCERVSPCLDMRKCAGDLSRRNRFVLLNPEYRYRWLPEVDLVETSCVDASGFNSSLCCPSISMLPAVLALRHADDIDSIKIAKPFRRLKRGVDRGSLSQHTTERKKEDDVGHHSEKFEAVETTCIRGSMEKCQPKCEALTVVKGVHFGIATAFVAVYLAF